MKSLQAHPKVFTMQPVGVKINRVLCILTANQRRNYLRIPQRSFRQIIN